MAALIRGNFVVAVWLCVVYNIFRFERALHHVKQLEEQLGPWISRPLLGPLVWAGGQIFLWIRFYRFAQSDARGAAAFMGLMLTLQVIVQLLGESIGIRTDATFTWLYSYFAASHLAYAFFGHSRDRIER